MDFSCASCTCLKIAAASSPCMFHWMESRGKLHEKVHEKLHEGEGAVQLFVTVWKSGSSKRLKNLSWSKVYVNGE